MSKRSLVLAAALASFLAGAGAGAQAGEPAGGLTMNIEGFVPVICRATVDASSATASDTRVDLGKLREFCNNPSGYQVWVDYPPELASATLIVDGQSVPLSASGTTLVSTSPTAAVAAHDLALDLPSTGVQATISVRVVTL